jgi:hypothetical protein
MKSRVSEVSDFEFGQNVPPFQEQTRRSETEIHLFHLTQRILKHKPFCEWMKSKIPVNANGDGEIEQLLSYLDHKYINPWNISMKTDENGIISSFKM